MGRYNGYIPKEPEMTVNTEVKGTLAKLLATENLTIEHRKTSTAYFDVERRLLALPIWKDVTGDVYDLLVGHEVGHALYTPADDFGTAPKDYVNVLEDARVERKMKVTYPGLRKSFFKGYQELNNRDFFAVEGCDISKMNLIDRINLHYKIGGEFDVPFTEEEQVWVDRVGATITFADVVKLAEELYAYAKECQKKQEPVPTPPTQAQGSSNSDEYDPPSNSQTDETSDEGEDTDSDSDSDFDESDVDPFSLDYTDPSVSQTERAWTDNQHTLVDDDAKEWIYLDLPKIKLDNVIVPWKVVQNDLGQYFAEHEGIRSLDMTYGKYEEYKKSAQKSVNYLVKQFEMKKSAAEYARAATSKTGVINTNKLHNYKFSDDIFKKVTVLPDGKNHGLIFQLDWSGSMHDVMMDTIRQLYNLIWFCKKVQIPFLVYAFQSQDHHYGEVSPDKFEIKENTLSVAHDFSLIELFSSKMNNRQLDNQMKYVWAQCWGMTSNWATHGSAWKYSLGSTPLAEAILCTKELVKRFRAVEKIEKVNVIALTDGEANPLRFVVTKRESEKYGDHWVQDYLCHNIRKVFILRDPVTGYQRKINPSPHKTTLEIVSFVREITDYNWIGFRLCSKSDVQHLLRSILPNEEEISAIMKTWTKERYAELKHDGGFDVQYFIPNRYIGGGTDDIEVKQKGEVATKAELTRAFRKHMGSKMTNKTLLNKFVEMIA
jgi:hypothetical protein